MLVTASTCVTTSPLALSNLQVLAHGAIQHPLAGAAQRRGSSDERGAAHQCDTSCPAAVRMGIDSGPGFSATTRVTSYTTP